MKRLFALIAFAILIIPGQLGAASLYANPDGTGGCDPNPGRTCYWEWADTDTLADNSPSVWIATDTFHSTARLTMCGSMVGS